MSLLEIKDLNISYQTRKETIVASSDVNFVLERGEILGIVGESGSGKSTIANAIICLLYTSPSPRDRTRSRMPSSA
mgnify:CR=1 FL=1